MAGEERRYELPGIEDLTKDQERVLALPREGRHLIVGGPGTGKTTVCLLRARRHARNRTTTCFWLDICPSRTRALCRQRPHAVTGRVVLEGVSTSSGRASDARDGWEVGGWKTGLP